jgi:acetyl esterase/lipase
MTQAAAVTSSRDRLSTLTALKAAGPFLRRRLRPPALDLEPPTATVRFSQRARGRPLPLLDIYAPPGADGAPTAVIVHGGGFVGGSRDMSAVGVLATDLVRRGFVVASVDYCLARPFGPALPDQIDDVRAALRYWMRSARDYGGDPARTALIGKSAGAALAVLAADAAPFAKFVGIYGAYDLRLLPARWATASLLTRAARPADRERQSPLTRARFPQPALLIHGTTDPLAPQEHSLRLLAERQRAGLPTETLWLPGAVHGFLQDGPDHPDTAATLRAVADFLDSLRAPPEGG